MVVLETQGHFTVGYLLLIFIRMEYQVETPGYSMYLGDEWQSACGTT